MSLYSVKVSLKLRAGVAQRPIFARETSEISKTFDTFSYFLTDQYFFVSASRDPVLDNRKKDRLKPVP